MIMEARRPNVLLVEDDLALASLLTDELRARNYDVCHVESAGDAEASLDQVHPDLILLDLMLPDRNGLVMCPRLKARARAPVIICSATKRQEDAAIGFELGADDFLRKPFSVDELQARIELTLRRRPAPTTEQRPNQAERFGALSIDTARCVASMGDRVLQLTPTEYRLLCAVASRPGEVVARRELAQRVWGCVDEGVLRSLDVHMRRLRAKLSAASRTGPYLVTRRGFGFELVDRPEVPGR